MSETLEATSGVKFTLEELIHQNKMLSEALKQCQKDKEFVWNLWKDLQLEKPEMTDIISDIVVREQQKSDVKDMKVLSILQQKDNQIKILQEIVADFQTQLKQANERLSDLLMKEADWKDKQFIHKEEINKLNMEIDYKNEVISAKAQEIEHAEIEYHQQTEKFQKKIQELVANHSDLKVKNDALESALKEQNAALRRGQDQLLRKDQELLKLVKSLDGHNKQKQNFYDEKQILKKEITASKLELEKQTEKMKKYHENVDGLENLVKEKEFALENALKELQEQQAIVNNVRCQLSEHESCSKVIAEQSELIKKLETLQDETQKVISQQQDTHKKEVTAIEKIKEEQKIELKRIQEELEELFKENENLKRAANRAINGTDVKDSFSTTYELKTLLQTMENELEATRVAHKKRLQRYQLLEENHELVLKQLVTYESSVLSPCSSTKEEIPRASTKSLRKEDSSSVWNELEYFRQKYEKLNFQQPKLEEEVDRLRVKTANDQTKIQQLTKELKDERKLNEAFKREADSKTASLEKECGIWKEQIHVTEKDIIALHEANIRYQSREIKFKQVIEDLKSRIQQLTKEQNNIATQTYGETYDSKQLYDKLNEVIHAVHHEKLTVSQLESSIQDNVRKHFKDASVQTDLQNGAKQTINVYTQAGSGNEKDKKKSEKLKNLYFEKEQLQLLKSELNQENHALKKRIVTLENQISQLREAKNNLSKTVADLQDDNESVKDELVVTLEKLQSMRVALKDRDLELRNCQKDIQEALTKNKQEKEESKRKSSQLKAMQTKYKYSSESCSKLSQQLKSLNQENDVLTTKVKEYQERLIKVEKTISQKKDFVEDLKSKNKELTVEKDEIISKMDSQLKKFQIVSERGEKDKEYIENLKTKLLEISMERTKLEEKVVSLQMEVSRKSQLLQENQSLCKRAESAIKEMEKTAYSQLETQQKHHEDKEKVLRKAIEDNKHTICEFQKTIKVFCEKLLSLIHTNKSRKMEQLKEKQEELGKPQNKSHARSEARELACTILNMSAADLEMFMKDDHPPEVGLPVFEDNDIREKLDIILGKDENFGDVLSKFLQDLVEYNSLLQT